jgi:vacuolar-type H+-ATPase subunit I/STV1
LPGGNEKVTTLFFDVTDVTPAMSPKSELVSVRVEEDLADELGEAVEKRKQVAGEYDDEPEEPEVLRRVLRLGVEVIREGDTRLERAREERDRAQEERDRLQEENKELRARLEDPDIIDWLDVTRNTSGSLKFGLAGVLVVTVGFGTSLGGVWAETVLGATLPEWFLPVTLTGALAGVSVILATVFLGALVGIARRARA